MYLHLRLKWSTLEKQTGTAPVGTGNNTITELLLPELQYLYSGFCCHGRNKQWEKFTKCQGESSSAAEEAGSGQMFIPVKPWRLCY